MYQKNYLLALYFLLSFFIAWGSVVGVYMLFGFPEKLAVSSLSLPVVLVIMFMVHAPTFAGLIASFFEGGKRAVKTMILSMFQWQASVKYYLVALGVFPLLMILLSLVLSVISDSYLPNFFVLAGLGGVISSFWEEVGWTGFATPRMLSRYTPIRTAWILGLIHAVWHLFANYWGSNIHYGDYFWVNFFFTSLGITFLRVFMVWLWCKTKSGLVTYLAHASWTGGQLALIPFTLSAQESTWWNIVFTLVVGVLIGLIIIKDKRVFFQNKRAEYV